MAAALRTMLTFLSIMGAAMAGTWVLGRALQHLPPIATPIAIFTGISAALWWRVRWGIKNPFPKGSGDNW